MNSDTNPTALKRFVDSKRMEMHYYAYRQPDGATPRHSPQPGHQRTTDRKYAQREETPYGVLHFLIDNCDVRKWNTYVCVDTIARAIHVSEKAVKVALADLEAAKLIRRKRVGTKSLKILNVKLIREQAKPILEEEQRQKLNQMQSADESYDGTTDYDSGEEDEILEEEDRPATEGYDEPENSSEEYSPDSDVLPMTEATFIEYDDFVQDH